MKLGKVVGHVWATKKDESLNGYKLMLISPLNPENSKNAEVTVAVDLVGAGINDVVIISQGSSARMLTGNSISAPIDAAIVGIVDEVEHKDKD